MSEDKNLTTHQVGIKSEPDESDGSDNGEEDIYKNLTEEQLRQAREYNECFICQKRCTNFSTFRRHVFQHSNAGKYKCEKCFKEFDQLKYLNAHLTTHNENRSLTCDICSQNFATKNSIRGHMRVHTGEKPYKCHLCDRSFSESSTRRKHILTHLPAEIKQLSAYTCEICGKVIKSLYNFKEHMAIHTGNKDVKCPICSKSFARKSTLRIHIAVHADRPKEHICELCSKGFHHRASLWKHKKKPCLPLKVNASQCVMCVKMFTEIAAQVQGDEKETCKLCGKTFRTARSLSFHLNKHIADKKVQCIICANKTLICDPSPV